MNSLYVNLFALSLNETVHYAYMVALLYSRTLQSVKIESVKIKSVKTFMLKIA